MTTAAYRIFSVIILLLIAAFPIYQIVTYPSMLFYTNGWDEASYLQYDYAKHVLEISGNGRLSQWLVVALHDLGLSGGQINLLFDFLTSVIFLCLLPRFLEYSGYKTDFSRAASVTLLGLPLVLSNMNPLYASLQNENMQRDSIKFFTMPYINDPFWLRTPEPQLSLCLLLILAVILIRFQKLFLLLPIIFIFYPFVAIPLGFAVLSYQLIKRGGFKARYSILLSALFISVALLAYQTYFMPPLLEGYIIKSKLPLISLCGILAAFFSFFTRRKADLSLVLCLSIWFAVNFQVLSGFNIQPNNYEQYWAAGACIFILLLALERSSYIALLPYLSLLLLITWSITNFYSNYILVNKIDLNQSLLNEIRIDASNVAINDIFLSTKLDMLYPKQKPLLFSYTRFYKKLPDLFMHDFVCAREALKDNRDCAETLKKVGEYFQNGDQNYIMNTIGRTVHQLPLRNFDVGLNECSSNYRCLRIYN